MHTAALRRHAIAAASCISLGVVFWMSQPVLAGCCKCKAPSSGDTVCMTIPGDNCGTFGSASTNESVKTLSCESEVLGAAQCKPAPDGVCTVSSDPISYGKTTIKDTNTQKVIPLKLNVPIPGVVFPTEVEVKDKKLVIPFLAQYIAGIYAYLLGITLIAAVIMITFGGFLYLLGSTFESINKGKAYIQDAVIGLILVFGSVTILQTINPATIQPQSLSVPIVEPVDGQSALFERYGTTDTDRPDDSEAPIPGTDGPAPTVGDPSTTPAPTEIDRSCPKLSNPAQENSYDRMQAVCTKGFSKDSLAKVAKTWKEEAVDKGAAAYIRGGYNGGKDAKLFPPQVGFMLSALYRSEAKGNMQPFNYLTPSIMSACGIPEGLRLKGENDNIAAISPQVKEALKSWGNNKTREQNACFLALRETYEAAYLHPVKCNNVLATDCGSFVSQVVQCAGGPNTVLMAREVLNQIEAEKKFNPSNPRPIISEGGKITVWTAKETATIEIATKDSKGNDILKKIPVTKGMAVSRDTCLSIPCNQKSYSGHLGWGKDALLAGKQYLRFGAVMALGCGKGVSHYFLYTGDAGLDFETLEAGGGTNAKGYRKGGVGFKDFLGEKVFFIAGMAKTNSFDQYVQNTSCTDNNWMYFINTL